ncbi:hypothetical protein LCGC14_1369030, partial [marine sediment metagenome]
VGEGTIEIKCPIPSTHIENIIKDKMPTCYIPQVQGQLWVTERKWWDLLSFNPRMPRVIVRVLRDEEYISKLRAALDVFIPTLAEKREEVLKKLGSWRPIEDQRATAAAIA